MDTRGLGEVGKRHRVLHVITRLIAGGADENTVASAVGIDRHRYQVDLAVGRESEAASFAIPDRVGLHVIPHLVRDIHPLADLRALIGLIELMRREKYDLVHTHTAKGGVLGRLAAGLAGVPRVVHTYHGATFHQRMSAPRRAFYIALEKGAARLTHRFIAVGEDVRESYVQARVVALAECRVIYSGMDLTRFRQAGRLEGGELQDLRRELGIPLDAALIGSVSRLEARKGHSYLIEAVAQLATEFPRAHLLVAGDGPLKAQLVALAQRAGLEGRAHFLGHRHDVERVMAMIDVFVLTSFLEGLPRVLVQAAAVGKPIIAFGAPGVREVVVHGHNGYVTHVGDVDALVVYFRRLLGDLETARAMGRRGAALVDDRWSETRMVDSLTAVYDELLEAA